MLAHVICSLFLGKQFYHALLILERKHQAKNSDVSSPQKSQVLNVFICFYRRHSFTSFLCDSHSNPGKIELLCPEKARAEQSAKQMTNVLINSKGAEIKLLRDCVFI